MKTMIVGDIHTFFKYVYDELNKHEPDHVIFLGDYFDEWHGTPAKMYETACFVKDMLGRGYDLCLGNHDMSYMFPGICLCSGFSKENFDAINSVLTMDDWMQMYSFVEHQEYVLSHAGMKTEIFGGFNSEDLIWSINLKHVKHYCEEGIEFLKAGIMHPAFQDGRDRGGRNEHGGITWCDWTSLQPLWYTNGDPMKQIVGHTPGIKPRYNQHNTCLDTTGQYIGIIEEGVLTVEQTDN